MPEGILVWDELEGLVERQVFRPCFTAPVWNHVLVLVAGAVLAAGKRSVTQALRVMGLAKRPGFGRPPPKVLSRTRGDARETAHRLLRHLFAALHRPEVMALEAAPPAGAALVEAAD